MTINPTTNLQYSWSLDLREILLLDDFSLGWITMTADLLINTGIGGAKCYREGPTTAHFIEVPAAYLVGEVSEPDLIVLEITRGDDMALAHLRSAWAGAEPVRDISLAGVES